MLPGCASLSSHCTSRSRSRWEFSSRRGGRLSVQASEALHLPLGRAGRHGGPRPVPAPLRPGPRGLGRDTRPRPCPSPCLQEREAFPLGPRRGVASIRSQSESAKVSLRVFSLGFGPGRLVVSSLRAAPFRMLADLKTLPRVTRKPPEWPTQQGCIFLLCPLLLPGAQWPHLPSESPESRATVEPAAGLQAPCPQPQCCQLGLPRAGPRPPHLFFVWFV